VSLIAEIGGDYHIKSNNRLSMCPQARYRNRLCGTLTGIRKVAKLLGTLVLVEVLALQIGGQHEGQGTPS